MEKRLGTILIVPENKAYTAQINSIIAPYADCIVSRQGIPHNESGFIIISLIVYATNDEIGALAGKLGKIKGIHVKSAVIKFHNNNELKNFNHDF